MNKLLLATGAAVLAITAPASADKGNGHGGGGDHGQQMKAGGGNGSPQMKADRGNRDASGGQQTKSDRPHGGGQMMRQAGQGDRDIKAHGNDGDKGQRRAEASSSGEMKMRGNDRKASAELRGDDRARVASNAVDDNRGRFITRNFNSGFGGFTNSCPPGLDRKDNGCLPPGQARKLLGARLQSTYADSLLPFQYRSWYRDDGDHFYRSGDGFIYRVSRSNDLVDGIIPMSGGGSYYALGDQWPSSYDFYNVPYQYRDYYADAGQYGYRYGDGAIYRVNSGSGVVDQIVALLAGDLGVGQQLPQGYDVYNVPFQYRDRYADTADNWYRYNDGYVYQVDPKTRLISAVIDAIV